MEAGLKEVGMSWEAASKVEMEMENQHGGLMSNIGTTGSRRTYFRRSDKIQDFGL